MIFHSFFLAIFAKEFLLTLDIYFSYKYIYAYEKEIITLIAYSNRPNVGRL